MEKTKQQIVASIAIVIALVVAATMAFAMTAPSANGNTEEPCVPKAAWTEVKEHPEEFHYETVVVTPAVEAVPGQHYSLKGNSGIGKDEVPPTPEVNPDIWQDNTEQEPHDNGNGGKNITWLGTPGSGLHYASKDSEGNRDWFYYRAPVEGQDEVTKQVKVVDKEAWTEVIEHPAVECPATPTPTPTTPTETPEEPQEETPAPEEPVTEDDPVVETETHHEPTKTVIIKKHESGKVTREVKKYPTDVVEEGL